MGLVGVLSFKSHLSLNPVRLPSQGIVYFNLGCFSVLDVYWVLLFSGVMVAKMANLCVGMRPGSEMTVCLL